MSYFSQYVKQSGPFQVSYLVTSIWVLVRVVFFCQFPVRLGAQRERERERDLASLYMYT